MTRIEDEVFDSRDIKIVDSRSKMTGLRGTLREIGWDKAKDAYVTLVSGLRLHDN